VTDSGGLQGSASISIAVVDPGASIVLSASGYKVKGLQKADLTWSGAAGTSVDVYRNGVQIVTTPNGGSYTDNIDQKGSGTYS
jgi:hypothetical protein